MQMMNVSVCRMGIVRIVVIPSVKPVHHRKERHCAQRFRENVSVCRMDMIRNVMIMVVLPVRVVRLRLVTEMDIVPVNKVISIHNKIPPPIGGGVLFYGCIK